LVKLDDNVGSEDSFEIKFENNHISAFRHGKEDINVLSNLWREVEIVCKKYNCYMVLCVSETTSALSTIDSFSIVDLLSKLENVNKYRIASVELNPEVLKTKKLTETLLFNRGLSVRLFSNYLEAEKWLTDG